MGVDVAVVVAQFQVTEVDGQGQQEAAHVEQLAKKQLSGAKVPVSEMKGMKAGTWPEETAQA